MKPWLCGCADGINDDGMAMPVVVLDHRSNKDRLDISTNNNKLSRGMGY